MSEKMQEPFYGSNCGSGFDDLITGEAIQHGVKVPIMTRHGIVDLTLDKGSMWAVGKFQSMEKPDIALLEGKKYLWLLLTLLQQGSTGMQWRPETL